MQERFANFTYSRLRREIWRPKFDVTIGSYDEAELRDLVGPFIQNSMQDMYGPNTRGLYRDDGLRSFNNISYPVSDRIRKDIIYLFNEDST